MKRECETCIKRKTPYCPTSIECMATEDMPYYQNRIMLLEENKQLKEIYKDLFNTYQKLKKENEEVTLLNLHQVDKIQQLEDNWNKLKEYIQKDYGFYDKLIAPEYGCAMGALSRIKDKMQELEQGSDSDE